MHEALAVHMVAELPATVARALYSVMDLASESRGKYRAGRKVVPM